MVAIDKKFRIDIPEEEFSRATNVNEAVLTVQRYLPEGAVAQAS
jgi:acyl carrier protein